LAPARFKVQFTASAELRDKLGRLTALLRTEVPDGDLAAVIDRVVTEKLERLEARRFGKTLAPRTTLAEADTSRASRCTERHRLEFHHRHPFAMGGDHRPDNIGLLCPQHNRLLAEHDYGRAAVRRRRVADRQTLQTGSGRDLQPQPREP
jgi:hypothetical protein